MDLSPKIEEEEVEKFGSKISVLSEYATALESHVKLRYGCPKDHFGKSLIYSEGLSL